MSYRVVTDSEEIGTFDDSAEARLAGIASGEHFTIEFVEDE